MYIGVYQNMSIEIQAEKERRTLLDGLVEDMVGELSTDESLLSVPQQRAVVVK